MVTIATAAATSRKAITRRRIIRLTRTSMATIMDRRIIRIIKATRLIRTGTDLTQASRIIRTGTIRDSRRTRTRTGNTRGSRHIRTSRRIIRRQGTTIIMVMVITRRSGSTAVHRTCFVEPWSRNPRP